MNVLILSANTGQGHNSCARALKDVFDEHGDQCGICDALAFVSSVMSRFVTRMHLEMYRKAPGAFSWGYGVSEKHSGIYGKKSPLYLFFRKGAKHLEEYIEKGNYDVVIACHVFAAVMLTAAEKIRRKNIRTAFTATDYTCSPSVDQSALDCYFIPDKSLMNEFISKGIPENRLYPTGLPVRKEFFSSINKAEAKMELGICPDHKHLIIMCGSMGCGPMEKLAIKLSSLLTADQEASIICGSNNKLKAKLEKKLVKDSRFHIYGYVDNMHLFMDSADLYLTKPGGISVTEAAAKRLPMVFVNTVSGCEEYNCSFFTGCKGAVCKETVDDLANECLSLLADDGRRALMADALSKVYTGNPAQEIYKILASQLK